MILSFGIKIFSAQHFDNSIIEVFVMNTTLMLTSDGFSFHTMELKYFPTMTEYHLRKNYLYDLARKKHKNFMYPISCNNQETHCCKRFKKQGTNLYFSVTEGPHATIKAVVNPRKLIDPDSSYLGIFPSNEDSVSEFADAFTDIMRKIGLPDFGESWSATRVDLCVNLDCGEGNIARELNRLAHKALTPEKYIRTAYTSDSLTPEKLKEKNKHYLRFENGSAALVIYDKTYQMTEEGLVTQFEELPNGIIRVELQLGRKFIRKFMDKNGIQREDPDTEKFEDLEALFNELIRQSPNLILSYLQKAVPCGTHYKLSRLKYLLDKLPFHAETVEQMQYLVQQSHTCDILNDAIRKTKKKFKLSEKEVKSLIKRFRDSDISPIPLSGNFVLDSLPSLTSLLKQLAMEGCTEIDL